MKRSQGTKIGRTYPYCNHGVSAMAQSRKSKNGQPFDESCEIEVAAGVLNDKPIVALRVVIEGEPSRFIVLNREAAKVLSVRISDAARQTPEQGPTGG